MMMSRTEEERFASIYITAKIDCQTICRKIDEIKKDSETKERWLD